MTFALFGPEVTRWSRESLGELQASLQQQEPSLQFVTDTLRELPALWEKIEDGLLEQSTHRPVEEIEKLINFTSGHSIPDAEQLQNIHLAPLTVIDQIVAIRRKVGDGGALPSFRAAQGFCIGFLTAAALASSSDWAEFEKNASTAIRLAVAIGAIIDAKEASNPPDARVTAISARLKEDVHRSYLEATLERFPEAYISAITDQKAVTITVPIRERAALTERLAAGKILSRPIGLYGVFHHSTHSAAAKRLAAVCSQHSELQLPAAEKLRLPLRSLASAELITNGSLHDVAVDSILVRRAHWFQTVLSSVEQLEQLESIDGLDFVPIGKAAFVPLTITRRKGYPSAAQISAPLLPTPTQPEVREEVAVVGMACRFPKADSLDEFWQLLRSGGTAIGEIPRERFVPAEITREPKDGKFYGNFLNAADVFDHRFFGLSGREAKSMDPQQRLALQVTYEALESSGYFRLPAERQATDVGCYLGVGSVDYEDNVAGENANAFSAVGTLRAFITGRISHHFGFSGPSITFDTACSSSAVAIHSACKAILAGECSVALAGGVNVITSPNLYQNLMGASFLSPTGSSKAFDASADGYCRGEGAGIVLLKPLSKAVLEGDTILGVIAGSAVNQGSNCSPITVPVSQSQSSLYEQAMSRGGIKPKDVTFVEAHGTGTPVGDPIEYESVRSTFSKPGRDNVYLGSVKDNIGHTEGASGAAGLVKALLMIQHRSIPKQANFKTLNPRIKSSNNDRITVPTETLDWTAKRAVALVNNYGAGGSNAAIVLREYQPPSQLKLQDRRVSNPGPSLSFPILLAAKTAEDLVAYAKALKAWIPTSGRSLPDIAYQLSRRANNSFEYRTAFTASSTEKLVSSLEDIIPKAPSFSTAPWKYPVVLCFGGQAGQKVTLSRDLYDRSELLRDNLNACDSACKSLGLPSIYPTIFEEKLVEDLASLHCLLFSLQYSSAKCWIDSGIEVDTLIGHSFGQLTALCVAESVSLLDGLRFVSGRARLMRDNWGPDRGVMLSVEGDRADVESVVQSMSKEGTHVDFACYNGSTSFVLAGDSPSIAKAETLCSEAGCKTKQLNNSHAYHSHLTDGILPELNKLAESIEISKPRLNVETCSPDGSWSEFTAEKIVQHTRQPVHFYDAVERISSREPSAVWLEAGSATPVIAMARRVLTSRPKDDGSENVFTSMALGTKDAPTNLADAICQLWKTGSRVQHWMFHHSEKNSYTPVNLPPYQFEKRQHWIDFNPRGDTTSDESPSMASAPSVDLITVAKRIGPNGTIYSVNNAHPAFELAVRGHAVTGQPLCPASMYVELATQCAVDASSAPSGKIPQTSDLNMLAPLGLNADASVFLRLSKAQEDEWEFSVYSRPRGADGETVHANGYVSLVSPDGPFTTGRMQMLKRLARKSRADQILEDSTLPGVSGSMVYKTFGDVVDYADYYRGVKRISAMGNESAGIVSIPDAPAGFDRGVCDPIAIDNFLQVAGIHVNCLLERKSTEVFMCTTMDDIALSEEFVTNRSRARRWFVYTRCEKIGKGTMANHIFAFDPETKKLELVIIGAIFRSVPFQSVAQSLMKLNDFPTSSGRESATDDYPSSSSSTLTKGEDSDSKDSSPSRKPRQDAAAKSAELMADLRELLSTILEMPTGEIEPSSKLDELGIDSLLITEVLAEIQKLFKVELQPADLSEVDDVVGLCRLIQPEDVDVSESAGTPPTVDLDSKPTDSAKLASKAEQVESGDADQSEGNFGQASQDSFAEARSTYDEHAAETGFKDFCSEVLPSQMDLVVRYVVDGFSKLGCDVESLKAGDEVPMIPYIAQHGKLIPQLYKILETAGLIEKKNGIFRRTASPAPQEPSSVLHQLMLDKFPQHASETKLLNATGPKLAECLSGTVDPISLIFKDATARTLLEDVYTNAPMFKAGTMLLAQYLYEVLEKFDGDREIRILELGAGTGGTTKYLLEKLTKSKQKIKYTFTDLSPSLVGQAKRKFGQYKFMDYTTVDIEKDPKPEQLGAYDIILSTNCIHATHNLVLSTTNIRKMLRPNGILCLVELNRNLYWFDLVFGLLEGWWLFDDGRKHVLADEKLWERNLHAAGFNWVDWSDNESQESDVLRVVTASAAKPLNEPKADLSIRQETTTFKEVDGLKLNADIYYPGQAQPAGTKLPVALMIHGGGHIMLSRNDIRPEQTQMLLQSGFLPISVDYRLCPETTLRDGPIADVADALAWARNVLPSLSLKRKDICVDGETVISVGWSTGGTLALSLGWTAPSLNVRAPDATLVFYCPTDYEDPFWTKSNVPAGSEKAAARFQLDDSLWDGVFDGPVTGYNVDSSKRAVGGWLATSDPRSKIALYMNWKGCSLNVLLRGLDKKNRVEPEEPTAAEVAEISPLAHISNGSYKTPTFIVHPRKDDLIPLEQAERTYKALQANGIDSEFRAVENAVHLFDVYRGYESNEGARCAVRDGYDFLCQKVGLKLVA